MNKNEMNIHIYSQFHISPPKKITQCLCLCPCANDKIHMAIMAIFLLSLTVLITDAKFLDDR